MQPEHTRADDTDALDGLEMAELVAAGAIDWRVARWLFVGFRKFLRDRGSVSLGRCLGLELTPAQLRLQQRNRWLIEAAAWVEGDSAGQRAEVLAREYERFITRGEWLHWRGLEQPPHDASRLRAALFRAALASCDDSRIVVPLGAKQIERIAGHVLRKKCPLPGFTIDPSP